MKREVYEFEQRIEFPNGPQITYGWYITDQSFPIRVPRFDSVAGRRAFLQYVTAHYDDPQQVSHELIAGLLLAAYYGDGLYSEAALSRLAEYDVTVGILDWPLVMVACNARYSACLVCGMTVMRCNCPPDSTRSFPRVVNGPDYNIPDMPIKMRSIRVIFAEEQHTIQTTLNGTRREIVRYYDQPLQVGRSDVREQSAYPQKIQFLPVDSDGVTIEIPLGTGNAIICTVR